MLNYELQRFVSEVGKQDRIAVNIPRVLFILLCADYCVIWG